MTLDSFANNFIISWKINFQVTQVKLINKLFPSRFMKFHESAVQYSIAPLWARPLNIQFRISRIKWFSFQELRILSRGWTKFISRKPNYRGSRIRVAYKHTFKLCSSLIYFWRTAKLSLRIGFQWKFHPPTRKQGCATSLKIRKFSLKNLDFLAITRIIV